MFLFRKLTAKDYPTQNVYTVRSELDLEEMEIANQDVLPQMDAI